MDAITRIGFPIYAIGTSNNQFIVSEVNGIDCYVFYGTKELAELYLEQLHHETQEAMFPIMVKAGSELALLVHSASDIKHFVWNAVLRPETFQICSLADLI